MPVLVYFAVIGSVLVALLFVADSTLEKNVSSPIVTSQRIGLPAPRYRHANTAKAPTTVPAPAPDMTSQDVLAAQPKSAPDTLPTIESKAREARAEARPSRRQAEVSAKNARVEATLQNHRLTQVTDHQRKIEPEARDARPEATPQNQRLTQVTDRQQKIESESREPPAEAPPQNQQNQFDRFSIKAY
jgi:hypothetical protein